MHSSTSLTARKSCSQCHSAFEVTEDDLAFYEKVSPVFAGEKMFISPPTLCPLCREQRRCAFRNERMLYRRTCDLCKREILSIYSQDKQWKVYCPDCFNGSGWSAESYGRKFDFSKPFFVQLEALKRDVPRLSIDVLKNENSDYSNVSIENRDCYLVFATVRSQRCFYTRKILHGTDSLDCTYGEKLELCYECMDCNESYHLQFSQQCENCSFSSFCFDCTSVQNCFLCSNLRNKQYCLRNEQLTKEEYERRVPALDKASTIAKLREEFEALKRRSIHRENQNVQAENCTGNYLRHCQNCRSCFDVHNAQDDVFCTDAITGSVACRDCSYVTMECEWDYECSVCSNSTSLCSFCYGCRDGNAGLLYCDLVYGTRDSFGCIALRHGKNCILNTPYSKEEYEKLMAKIVRHMRATGEWGEYFPVNLSPYDYNETVAAELFPLSRNEALAEGYRWRDIPEEPPKVQRTIPASKLPDSIGEIPDDIVNWAIECEATRRPFKIIRQELDFYRKMRLPIPRFHPDERHRRRMALRNPRKLWQRICAKCSKEIQTTYAPKRPEIVYCEECYLKEVY